MSLVIPMERNAIDSAIESAAVLTTALQRVLLEAQASLQEYIANQQISSEARKLMNARLLAQYHQLKQIERKAKSIATTLQKNKPNQINIEKGLHLQLLNEGLPNDINRIKQSYYQFYNGLKNIKELSLVSWSINRRLAKIHQSLDESLAHFESIKHTSLKLYRYSNAEYKSYQKAQLAPLAVLVDEPLILSSDDLEFMLDSMDKPPKPPSPAMQRALEQYAQCS